MTLPVDLNKLSPSHDQPIVNINGVLVEIYTTYRFWFLKGSKGLGIFAQLKEASGSGDKKEILSNVAGIVSGSSKII